MDINGLEDVHSSCVDLGQETHCEDDGKDEDETDDEVSADFEIVNSEPNAISIDLEASDLNVYRRVENENDNTADNEIYGTGKNSDGIKAVSGRAGIWLD